MKCSQFRLLIAVISKHLSVEQHDPEFLIYFFSQLSISPAFWLTIIFPPHLPVIFMRYTWLSKTMKTLIHGVI
jgi:hypothetical protein